MRVSYYLANRYTRPWAENSYKLLSLLIAKKPVFWAGDAACGQTFRRRGGDGKSKSPIEPVLSMALLSVRRGLGQDRAPDPT